MFWDSFSPEVLCKQNYFEAFLGTVNPRFWAHTRFWTRWLWTLEVSPNLMIPHLLCCGFYTSSGWTTLRFWCRRERAFLVVQATGSNVEIVGIWLSSPKLPQSYLLSIELLKVLKLNHIYVHSFWTEERPCATWSMHLGKRSLPVKYVALCKLWY